MTSRRYTYLLSTSLLALALASGCGGDNFEDKIATIESEAAAFTDVICDCYAELNHASKADCIADRYTPYTPAERTCLSDAAALDQEASDLNVDCQVDLIYDYSDCIGPTLDCTTLNQMDNPLMNCGIALINGLGSCPSLPQNVAEANAACFPQP